MSRLATSIAALVSVLSAPAFAADWQEDWVPADAMRGGYSNEPKDWSGLGDTNDDVGIEFGVRYWYSLGAQNYDIGGSSISSNDQTHAGEVHLRVDDYSSRSYVKGLAGYSIAISGDYSDGTGTGAVSDGKVGYLGGDFGWNAFGDDQGSGIGLLAGYLYWNDSPNTSRYSFTSATSAADIGWDPATGQTFVPGDSEPNNVEIHALRLGVQGKAKFGGMFDVSAELAAVPYAKIRGTLGSFGVGATYDNSVYAPGNIATVMASPTTLDGWGYGAMGEVMVGVTPVENLTFRLGGRAWYLQGTAEAHYSEATIGNPSSVTPDPDYEVGPTFSKQSYVIPSNPFSLFRYGLLAEMTYSF